MAPRPFELRRADGCWLWIGGPVPRGAAAMTLGPLVLVRRGKEGDAELLRHELVHVRQWKRFGVVGFLVRYLRPYARARFRGYSHWGAYRRIPFEIEAEWVARRAGPSGAAPPPSG